MNDAFQRRLAKLAEQNPDHRRAPPEPPTSEAPRKTAARGGSGVGRMVLFGGVMVIGLPALALGALAMIRPAATQTAALEQDTSDAAQVADSLTLGRKMMQVMDGAGQTDEGRAARAELDRLTLRMTLGKMTQEDYAYWNSPEGQAKFSDLTRKALNIEAAYAVAPDHFDKP